MTKPGRFVVHMLAFEGFREDVRTRRAEAADPDEAFTPEQNETIDRLLRDIDEWERRAAEIERGLRRLPTEGAFGLHPFIRT